MQWIDFFSVLNPENQSWFPALKSSSCVTSIHESELLNDCCFSLFVVWSLPCMVSTWTEDEIKWMRCHVDVKAEIMYDVLDVY